VIVEGGWEYDGSTSKLVAKTPIVAGPSTLFLTIFDALDRELDSAVAIDALRVSPDVCTAGVAPPLGSVQNLTATPGNGQVTLNWDPPADQGAGVVDYEVLIDDGSGNIVAESSAGLTSYVATGLSNGTNYSFVVVAIDADFQRANSLAVSATPSATTPGAVSGVVATPGAGEVTVSWAAAADGGSPITETRVQVLKNGVWQWGATALPPFTSGTVKGLTGGTEYSFRVRSLNAVGWGPWSSVVVATPVVLPATPPGAITSAVAVGGAGQATVSWTAPTNGGSPIIDTRVQVLKDGVWVWGATAVGTATTGVVTGLTGGTTYSFRVRAQNAAGWGPWSPIVTGTPSGV
jgi:hypothetical protein